jgi:hypothetical protein
MSYGMYTDEGDEAVARALAEVKRKPKNEQEIWEIINEICTKVIAWGKGQINPSNYEDGDNEEEVEGFEEVEDTVVSEALYESLMEDMVDE